jgi:glycogen debranching enzyme
MITFNKDILHNFEAATSREWLETNGIGGFACSTTIGLNTRRYHALLTAAMRPPAGRVVLLSKLDETVVIDGQRYDLSTNQYSGAIHPQGYVNMEEFRLDPYPILTFAAGGVRIEKLLFMVHGQTTTVIQYRVREPVIQGHRCVGGAMPDGIDMSTLGNPGKFAYCIGENEEERS